MAIDRIAVFLPCHSLEDFPTWLEEPEADELLAAWTAAWDPRLIAAIGRMPGWASAEVPPHDGVPLLGIVPPACDERITASLESTCQAGSIWVRRQRGRQAIVAAALEGIGGGIGGGIGVDQAPAPWADDFHALGLAWLLTELLSRRMRSGSALSGTSLETTVVAAARAATGGADDETRRLLTEAFGTLEAARGHYYPVDVWLLDLVLLAETTLGPRLAAELEAPSPLTIVATGRLIEHLAATDPPLCARLRAAIEAGRVAPAGGRDDDAPLDAWMPESILDSFLRGRRTWHECLGTAPQCFARVGGGTSPLLPQVLAQLGYAGAVWNLFDGTTLPDPGSSRIRWEGGGGSVEAVAKPPLDARSATTILRLPERLGDAMDHDHTAVLSFAHFAGTASPWFEDLRRITTWTGALGRFVLPEEFFRRTAGAGSAVSLEPDSYPPSLPPPGASLPDGADPVASRLEYARQEARQVIASRAALGGVWPRPDAGSRKPAPPARTRSTEGGLLGLFRRRATADRFVIEGNGLRVRVHPQTGGILSLRRSGERGNRLSQLLAVRTTRPPPPTGSPWEDPLERAEYTTMIAESIERTGPGVIESRGRLERRGRAAGRFRQRVMLDERLPLVRLALAIDRLGAIEGTASTGAPRLESYACCRFAWNENEDIDLRRGQGTQSIVSERTLLAAPHFIEITAGAAPAGSGTTILTGGLPWHLRSSPHMLDAILPAGPGVEATLAVGLGLERPWDLGVAFTAAADGELPLPAAGVPDHVRLVARGPLVEGNRTVGAVVGVLEVTGRGGDVRIDWGVPLTSARLCDALGRPVDGQPVEMAGGRTSFHLRRYGWLLLELRFDRSVPPPEGT